MASEDDEKELELKDLIIQTLEANGILPKLKAQIRSSVFTAIDESDKSAKTITENPLIKNLLNSREGRLTMSIVREFLLACHLDYTIAVFDPEINANKELDDRSKLAKNFDIYETDETKSNPLLFEIVKGALNNQVTRSKKVDEIPESTLNEAKKKFDRYDKDKNGIIDKNELRDLFIDLYPTFNRNMIERYVNDEFSASDKNLSNGIDFNEFKSIYKRLFLQCRSVVLHDIGEIIDDRSEKSESMKSASMRAGANNNKLLTATIKPTNNNLIDIDDSSSSSSSSLTEKFQRKEKETLNNTKKQSNNKNLSGNLLDDENFFSKKPNGNNSIETQKNNKIDQKTSLKDAPNLFAKPSSNVNNMRDIDKKIKGLGIGDYDEDNYDDDFTSGTTPRTQSGYVDKRRIKNRNFAGSDDEIDENISYAEESSKFDEMTIDKSISTLHGNNDADYLEDLSN